MSKSAFIRARVEPELKTEVEAILKEMGVSTSQVLTMLYRQIRREHKIPLDLHLPNKETAQAIKEARAGENVVTCKNADDLFEKWGI